MSTIPRIPPLALLLGGGLLIWLSRLVPGLHLPLAPVADYAFGVAVLGLTICISAIYRFRRADTTANPLDPSRATRLVTGGVFAFSRNPMYLGMSLVLLSWAMLAQHALGFAVVPLYVLFLDRVQIPAEEAALRELFGAEYAVYCSTVRRWL